MQRIILALAILSCKFTASLPLIRLTHTLSLPLRLGLPDSHRPPSSHTRARTLVWRWWHGL